MGVKISASATKAKWHFNTSVDLCNYALQCCTMGAHQHHSPQRMKPLQLMPADNPGVPNA